MTGRTQRVLDLDLDFFVHGVEHWAERDSGRLDEEWFPPWSLDDTMDFLTDRCGLTGPLPGCVVEHHGELFARWRDAIDTGLMREGFHVTHVDAHADLGMGDAGYIQLMSDLLFREPHARRDPGDALTDGNYLIFALGCRWLSGLDYVYNSENPDGASPGDLMRILMEDFNVDAANLQLAALPARQIEAVFMPGPEPTPVRLEPTVPFRHMGWPQFRADAPYDVICLARSPEYTPPGCDPLFDAIRERFIDETGFPMTDTDLKALIAGLLDREDPRAVHQIDLDDPAAVLPGLQPMPGSDLRRLLERAVDDGLITAEPQDLSPLIIWYSVLPTVHGLRFSDAWPPFGREFTPGPWASGHWANNAVPGSTSSTTPPTSAAASRSACTAAATAPKPGRGSTTTG